jgi:hypothetical protein
VLPDLNRLISMALAVGIVWACIPAMYHSWVRILSWIVS